MIINNEISLTFVKGFLAERKGLKVCWVGFVEEVQSQGSQAHKATQKYYSKSKQWTRRYFERGAKIKNRKVELIENRKRG
jgi:hypothetical protein